MPPPPVVEAVTAGPYAEALLAASRARTAKEYAVPAESPDTVAVVPLTVVAAAPFTVTS